MSALGKCRDCQADVRWVRTSYGRMMPLDPEPNAHGNVVIVLGFAEVIDVKTSMTMRTRYMPHFASCPKVHQVELPGF